MTDLFSSAFSSSSWQKWILLLVLLSAAGLWISPVSASDATDWNEKGNAFYDAGQYNEALAAYNKALEFDPNYVNAWDGKGSTFYLLGRYEEALTTFNKALELDPNIAKAWSNKGQVLARLGRNEEALTAYNKSLELDPNYVNAWNNKGQVLDRIGRYEDSLTAYNKALELGPNIAIIWNNKGIVLINLGRNEEAIIASNKALELDPNIAKAWSNKGLALARLGRNEEALTAYNKALELDPNSAVAWNGKGVTLDSLGRNEEALTAYNKSLELDPNYTLAITNKNNVLLKLSQGTTTIVTTPATQDFTSFNPLIIIGIILLLCIGGGVYYVFHSRKPKEDFLEEEPEPAPGISSSGEISVKTSTPESKSLGISNAILDRINSTEKNIMPLTLYRTPVENLLTLSRHNYSLGKYPDADHVLKKAEAAIGPLKNCESQLSQWKNRGYDTALLETIRTDVAEKILSTFREFEQAVKQLEKVQNGLDELKKKYPAIITQAEFQPGISSLEQNLKKPDQVTIVRSEFERLNKNIEHYAQEKDRREQHLRSQVTKVQEGVSDALLVNEANEIMKFIRKGDLPASEQFFKELVSRQVTRVNDTIVSLRKEGVVIPPSLTPIQQKPDDDEYGDRLIETSRKWGELDRLKVQFSEATAMKDTVRDTRLLALYDNGEYEQFINKCKIQEQLAHDSKKPQKNRGLIFISSKSEDFNSTQQVYTFLKDRGCNVFFSQQSLPDMGSSDYRKEIDRALDVSKHMIVVTSKKEHVEASWVEAEWGLFINEKRSGRKLGNIITLIIGTMRIEDLPSSLRYYEVIPFDPKTFEKILKYLK